MHVSAKTQWDAGNGFIGGRKKIFYPLVQDIFNQVCAEKGETDLLVPIHLLTSLIGT